MPELAEVHHDRVLIRLPWQPAEEKLLRSCAIAATQATHLRCLAWSSARRVERVNVALSGLYLSGLLRLCLPRRLCGGRCLLSWRRDCCRLGCACDACNVLLCRRILEGDAGWEVAIH
eukprot:scaffold151822_cov33-Tisochrysis_lutea.AAC.5